MLVAYHSPSAVQTAVDLANTFKPIKGEDTLETVEQLEESRTAAMRRRFSRCSSGVMPSWCHILWPTPVDRCHICRPHYVASSL